MIDKCSCKGHPDIPCRLIITLFRVLTPARWWSRLKFCTGHIHLCTCCGCISNQLKAQITGISSHVTNGVAIECHLAIVDVNRIITQCCRARFKRILPKCICVQELVGLETTLVMVNLRAHSSLIQNTRYCTSN